MTTLIFLILLLLLIFFFFVLIFNDIVIIKIQNTNYDDLIISLINNNIFIKLFIFLFFFFVIIHLYFFFKKETNSNYKKAFLFSKLPLIFSFSFIYFNLIKIYFKILLNYNNLENILFNFNDLFILRIWTKTDLLLFTEKYLNLYHKELTLIDKQKIIILLNNLNFPTDFTLFNQVLVELIDDYKKKLVINSVINDETTNIYVKFFKNLSSGIYNTFNYTIIEHPFLSVSFVVILGLASLYLYHQTATLNDLKDQINILQEYINSHSDLIYSLHSDFLRNNIYPVYKSKGSTQLINNDINLTLDWLALGIKNLNSQYFDVTVKLENHTKVLLDNIKILNSSHNDVVNCIYEISNKINTLQNADGGLFNILISHTSILSGMDAQYIAIFKNTLDIYKSAPLSLKINPI